MQLGSLLSIHGCYHNLKTNSNNECYLKEDTEHGLHVPLAHGVNGNGVRLSETLDDHGTLHALITSAVWDDLFQVLYQVYLMFCPVEDTAAKSCFSVLHGYNKMNSFLGFSFPMSYLYTRLRVLRLLILCESSTNLLPSFTFQINFYP